MTAIHPMLLTESNDKEILKSQTHVFQVKENGHRAIIHVKDGNIVGIRSRGNNPVLHLYPELKDVAFNLNEAILDAEVCVFNDGKSVFYGGIDRRRSVPTEAVLNEFPITIVVFDVLKFESDILVGKPYRDRYAVIRQHIKDGKHVRVAKNYTNGAELWKQVVKNNLEGVVAKNPMAIYELGSRSKNYLKLKNYKETNIIVTDTEPNEKGTKIHGTAQIGGNEILVECQMAGQFDIQTGSQHRIRYLDTYKNRLIQPTKAGR